MDSTHLPVVIVLACGRGERFLASGGSTHKLRALLAGQPVLSHTLQTARASGLAVHLVEGESAGMGDSIANGVRATVGAAGWLVLPGDLPLVQAQTLLEVAHSLQRHSVVVPMCQGQKGHPVGFSSACRDDLLQLSGDVGAASVTKKYGARLLEVDDVGFILDVDTVYDLARAEQFLLAGRR